MKVNDEIQPLVSDFERIKQVADNGSAFWSARDLCTAMGYSTYQKFERILKKAQETASAKGLGEANHFNQAVEMVRLGSGSFRKVENSHLSREACLLVAEKADRKKPQVQMALRYFSQNDSAVETVQNSEISSILLYKTSQGESRIEVIFNSDTFWMPQKRMAELYGVDVRTISYHLGEIFQSGELAEKSVLRKIGITAADGKVYDTNVYNLDAIIAVGYRVNSYQATQFRIWATTVLKEMIVKGFVLDDERLKQGTHFGKDYFDDLLERIREIRASERRYYQKITDIYAECSADYDPKSEATLLQNRAEHDALGSHAPDRSRNHLFTGKCRATAYGADHMEKGSRRPCTKIRHNCRQELPFRKRNLEAQSSFNGIPGFCRNPGRKPYRDEHGRLAAATRKVPIRVQFRHSAKRGNGLGRRREAEGFCRIRQVQAGARQRLPFGL